MQPEIKCLVITFLPGVSPGVSRSTIKPVNALLAGHLGSEFVRARRKYLKQEHHHLAQEPGKMKPAHKSYNL